MNGRGATGFEVHPEVAWLPGTEPASFSALKSQAPLLLHPEVSMLKTACLLASSILPVFCQDVGATDFAANELVVQTTSGAVRGTAIDDHAWAWLGIPYGRPPFGPLRWKAPEEPKAWDGIRLCDAPARRSRERGGVEDRLYLNVWRPQTNARLLPVLVDVHGGGNMAYDGMANVMHTVARNANCVVVTMNYRIGALGWFTHPSLRTGRPGDELNDSGNFGLLDIVHALKWVQKNIEGFGGDRKNVTLSGESSGASSVAFLLHSKLAEPYFHKAFLASAYPFAAPHSRGDKASRLATINMLVDAGLAKTHDVARTKLDGMSARDIAGFLRSRTPAQLNRGYRRPDGKGSMDWGDFDQPNIPAKYRRKGKPEFVYGFADGHVVSKDVDFGPGNWFPKPVMIGTDHDENKYFHHGHFKSAFDNAMQGDVSLDKAIEDSLAGQSRVRFDSVAEFKTGWNFINRITTGLFTCYGAQNPARAMVRSHPASPVYVFRFDYGSGNYDLKYPEQEAHRFFLGASHSFELPFFFDWMNVEPPKWVRWQKQRWNDRNYGGRKSLARAMTAYLSAFLHSSDGVIRRGADMPVDWQAWTADKEQFITFDADAESTQIRMNSTELVPSPDDLRHELEAWSHQPTIDYIKYFIIYSYQKNWF